MSPILNRAPLGIGNFRSRDSLLQIPALMMITIICERRYSQKVTCLVRVNHLTSLRACGATPCRGYRPSASFLSRSEGLEHAEGASTRFMAAKYKPKIDFRLPGFYPLRLAVHMSPLAPPVLGILRYFRKISLASLIDYFVTCSPSWRWSVHVCATSRHK